MSFDALQLKVSGSVMPAAPSGPATFVQGAYRAPTDPNPLVLPSAPTAGNRLILSGYSGNNRTFSAPDGTWTLAKQWDDTTDSRRLTIYTKISDGTETSIAAKFSGGTLHGGSVVEFANAGGIEAVANGLIAPSQGSTTKRDFSTIGAPTNTNAVPLIISGWESGGNTYTYADGWAGLAFASNGDSLVPSYMYLATPPAGGATSTTVSYSSGTNNANPTPYLCLWIDPK